MRLLINIDVENLDSAIDFYEKGLGLTLQRRLFEGTVAEMTGASTAIYLIENTRDSVAVAGTDLRRSYDRHWTPVHLDFPVEDLRAAVMRAVSAGATQEGEIRTFSWGLLATMSDPFGNGFCLLQFFGKDYEWVE